MRKFGRFVRRAITFLGWVIVALFLSAVAIFAAVIIWNKAVVPGWHNAIVPAWEWATDREEDLPSPLSSVNSGLAVNTVEPEPTSTPSSIPTPQTGGPFNTPMAQAEGDSADPPQGGSNQGGTVALEDGDTLNAGEAAVIREITRWPSGTTPGSARVCFVEDSAGTVSFGNVGGVTREGWTSSTREPWPWMARDAQKEVEKIRNGSLGEGTWEVEDARPCK